MSPLWLVAPQLRPGYPDCRAQSMTLQAPISPFHAVFRGREHQGLYLLRRYAAPAPWWSRALRRCSPLAHEYLEPAAMLTERPAPDIVVLVGQYAVSAEIIRWCRRLRTRTVVILWGLPPGRSPWRAVRNEVVRRLLRRSTVVVCNAYDQLAQFRVWLAPGPCQVRYIRQGVDVRFFDPACATLDRGNAGLLNDLRPADFLVAPGEGLRQDEFLWRALAAARRPPIVRVTRDPRVAARNEELCRRFGRPGDRIVLRMDFRGLRWLYANATAVLNLVDDSWRPAGYTSASESLACGAKLVMFAGGLTVGEIAHQCGSGALPLVTIPPGQPEALLESISRLAADRAFAAQLASRARAHAVAALPLEVTVREFERLFLELVGPAPSSDAPTEEPRRSPVRDRDVQAPCRASAAEP